MPLARAVLMLDDWWGARPSRRPVQVAGVWRGPLLRVCRWGHLRCGVGGAGTGVSSTGDGTAGLPVCAGVVTAQPASGEKGPRDGSSAPAPPPIKPVPARLVVSGVRGRKVPGPVLGGAGHQAELPLVQERHRRRSRSGRRPRRGDVDGGLVLGLGCVAGLRVTASAVRAAARRAVARPAAMCSCAR